MKKEIIFYFLFSLILNSCTAQTGEQGKGAKFIDYKVTKTIPAYRNGQKNIYYNIIKQASAQLKLDSLEIGYDSIQVRLWFHYSFKPQREVFIIKNQNNTWSGSYYLYSVNWDENTEFETVVTKSEASLEPNNKWEIFIDSIMNLQLMKLPNMEDIVGMKTESIDGDRVLIEISTKKEYKFLIYSNLDSYLDKNIWPATNMAKIVKLFRSQLEVKN